jgi:hypothetical protein
MSQTLFDSYRKVDRDHKESIRRNEEESKKISKDRLQKIIEKKFKTSIIGAIASIEKYFGDLWGHGLDFAELSGAQKEFREDWAELRNEILTKGNNQLRAAQNELNEYSVSWNKKDYIFKVDNSN